MKISLERKNEAVHFEGSNEDGQKVSIDGAPSIGGEGKGMRPMELLLTSIAACASFDVSTILTKQRQNPENFRVEASATREDQTYVKPFKTIQLDFYFEGNIDQTKARRAVMLAVEKYCSVAATLNPEIPLSYDCHFK